MADGSRSSLPGNFALATSPPWTRWLMPSVADLIFVAVLSALVFTPLSTRLLGDAGIGWHIRTGQQILVTHSIPHTDPFSSSMQGKPWFAWEWLYDVVVGQLDSWCGLNGVVWFTAAVIAIVFAWTVRLQLARGTNLLSSIILMLLAMAASMIHFLARPHVLSWLFALVWFWILDSTERDNFEGRTSGARRLWFLPLSMLVWVNVHGGFLLGFFLLGIFWLASLWTWFSARQNRIEESFQKIAGGRRTRTLTWIGILSAAASLLNPYGWNLHRHAYAYLSNRFLMNHIEEFQSPNFHGIAQRCFLLLLLITVAAVAVRGRKLRISEILLVLFAIYAGLYASRNIPVSSILLVLIVGPLLPAIDLSGFIRRMSAFDSRLRGQVWPVVAIVVTLLIAINGGRVGSAKWMDAHFDPTRMPVAAIGRLQQMPINGPVLAPDYWGGYLIYRLYPRAQVVIDDRHDLYGEAVLKSYLKMVHVEPGWTEFLDQRSISIAVLPTKCPLAVILAQTQGWHVAYADDVAAMFIRANLIMRSTQHSSER
jgi:hypothetical protein